MRIRQCLFTLLLAACTKGPAEVPGAPRPALAGATQPVFVDGDSLSGLLLQARAFPAGAWLAARDCLAGIGVPVSETLLPPAVYVVVGASSLTVRDPLVDRLTGGPRLIPYAVGYSFVERNIVLVIPSLADRTELLQHEALHFWYWHATKQIGHPFEVLMCDPLG